MDGVVVVDVRCSMTPGDVERVERLTERAIATSTSTVGVLVRVAAGVAFPTQEARQAFVAYLRAQRGRVRTIQVALEGEGFWAATMTALVAHVARAVPYGPPIQVHENVARAARALVAQLDATQTSTIDTAELTRAFERAS